MKKKQTKTNETITKTLADGQSRFTVGGISLEKAIAEYRKKKLPDVSEGANSSAATIIQTLDGIMANFKSFCLADVIYHLKSMGVPIEETKRIFNDYTKEMERLGQLTEVRGIYDYSTWVRT